MCIILCIRLSCICRLRPAYTTHTAVFYCIDRNDYDILRQRCLCAQTKYAQQPQSTQRNNARATNRGCKGFHTFLLRDTNQINNAQ